MRYANEYKFHFKRNENKKTRKVHSVQAKCACPPAIFDHANKTMDIL